MKKVKTTDGIAPWKLNSPIERFLARKADKSLFWKKAYVRFYKIFDSAYYKKGLLFIDKYIKMFVGEVTEKQRREYIVDMVYSLHRFGCMFDEYFLFGFSTLNTKGRESFITDKIRWSYYARMNTTEANELFNDKKKAYDIFRKFYKRDLILVSGEKDREVFSEFCKKHVEFIVKPYNKSGGSGIHKVNLDGQDVNACFDKIIADNTAVVCEELIVQSEVMASFHPSSVNSVRLPTIKDKDGVHVFHPLLRTGRGGSEVDNAARGGIFACINPETGIVETNALDERGNKFHKHPDTGVTFAGFQIPDWEQAVELAKALATVVEENRHVGWDLAHTDKGWVMVEGNPRGQYIMQQSFYRTGFRDEMEKLIMNV